MPSLQEPPQPQPPLLFGDYLFPENPSLQDLRQVFLLDKSSKQKDFRQSLQLHAHLMGLSISARVSRGLDLAYDHAHDAFKNRQRPDRRNEFISTFNYTHDETERILHHILAHPQPRPSFLDMVSPASSTAILTFLHRLRTDHSILATAFRNLQSQELDALLLPERPPLTLPSQIRGSRDRGYSLQVGSNAHGAQHPPSGQSITTQQRQQQQQHAQGAVPNYVNNQDVAHIILTNLFGPSSFEREHALRTGALTSIFVALLSAKKGERLMTEMLERFVTQSEWQHSTRAKDGFEKALLNMIQRGEQDLAGFADEELNANILPYTQHHPHHHSVGRMASVPIMKTALSGDVRGPAGSLTVSVDPRVQQPEMTLRQAQVEEFYTAACLQILDTLEEFSPPCLMELSKMIFAAINESTRPYASLIIVVKFFFYRFMNKCIAYPETYGMMDDIFISERQRQRILFTTHQRLYRYVTGILNPVPGWENRSSTIDPRIREKIDHFVRLFSAPTSLNKNHPPSPYTLSPISELSSPAPVASGGSRSSLVDGDGLKTRPTIITPVLLLCPSDFTTLFYFVCPHFRTSSSLSSLSSLSSISTSSSSTTTPSSSSSSLSWSASSAVLMTRSSSFSGKSEVYTRPRTSSETPPAYPPTVVKSNIGTLTSTVGSGAAAAAMAHSSTTSKMSHPPSATRTHKRASPSLSFFAGAAASLPFKSKHLPPPHYPLEKAPSVPAEITTALGEAGGSGPSTFLSLSGIKPGLAASPKTAPVEVTSTSGIAAASCAVSSSDPKGIGGTSGATSKSGLSTSPLASSRSTESSTTITHWSDEILLPELKAAIVELKRLQPGPIKEVPWAVNQASLTPLREPWALAYVVYKDDLPDAIKDSIESNAARGQNRDSNNIISSSSSSSSFAGASNNTDATIEEAGLALAPPCMAMVMENSTFNGGSRIVTVTKPILLDQVMDSAIHDNSNDSHLESGIELDLEFEGSDNESMLSSEDSTLLQPQKLDEEDKEASILRINSGQMLSAADESGIKPVPTGYPRRPSLATTPTMITSSRMEPQRSSSWRKEAADQAWKSRIRQAVQSEVDLPEDVRTVARSIFKILREFDIHAVHDGDGHRREGLRGGTSWTNYARSTAAKERLGSASYTSKSINSNGTPITANSNRSSGINNDSIRALLLQGIEQARRFGNHSVAVGFHHSLRILESSSVLRQLDSSKIIYLLAMPIKHRLEHRAGRATSRTLWESFAHSWHLRLVSAIERKRENMSSLRLKMYYQTCVRTSRGFEKSFGVILSLSRLNRAALRKYVSAEDWDRYNSGTQAGGGSVNSADGRGGTMGGQSGKCDHPGCKGSICVDHSAFCQTPYSGDSLAMGGSQQHGETTSRRYSANSGPHAQLLRASKGRRSSFSSYIDNVASRSFGSPSFLESSLSHLKEKEQASFSSSYSSGTQGSLWSGMNGGNVNSSSGHSGLSGSLSDTADVQSDFVMDARETEATQRWITDTGIHNFLPGEDNFLRFCMEIESVVRGLGLGGTGIQGAGITQAQNGNMHPLLSGSGSDFFVKEVAKFNGQFVAGMGPLEQSPQTTKTGGFGSSGSGGGGGVTEFLVNSFKNGTGSASSVPSVTGSYFFSQSSNPTSTANGHDSGSHPPTKQVGLGSGSGGIQGRSRIVQRRTSSNSNHHNAQQEAAAAFLQDDPSSIYAFPPGPTYALYNPPYSVNSHSTSSFSYSGSLASGASGGGLSSTSSPHQISQLPRDMNEFLRRIQLKLTSFVLSEWLDLFGEVEADRWFAEFLDEIEASTIAPASEATLSATKRSAAASDPERNDVGDLDDCHSSAAAAAAGTLTGAASIASLNVNQDEYFVTLNDMDLHSEAIHRAQMSPVLSPSNASISLTDLVGSQSSASVSRSSLHTGADSGPPPGSAATSWQSSRSIATRNATWDDGDDNNDAEKRGSKEEQLGEEEEEEEEEEEKEQHKEDKQVQEQGQRSDSILNRDSSNITGRLAPMSTFSTAQSFGKSSSISSLLSNSSSRNNVGSNIKLDTIDTSELHTNQPREVGFTVEASQRTAVEDEDQSATLPLQQLKPMSSRSALSSSRTATFDPIVVVNGHSNTIPSVTGPGKSSHGCVGGEDELRVAKPYDLGEAYRSTIEQFNETKSPYKKLGHLFALELLIVASLSYPDSCAEDEASAGPNGVSYQWDAESRENHSNSRPSSIGSRKGPDHHAAGIEDQEGSPPSSSSTAPRAFTPGTDAIVNEIEQLFRHPGGNHHRRLRPRPRHVLRDMQLIATFIPGSILDLRDDGKAFWDMALAISSLKNEVIEYVVKKGTRFVEVEESSRASHLEGQGQGQGQGQELNETSDERGVRGGGSGAGFVQDEEEERTRMAEAVRLFTIGAKESHPVAQRELAILYMSLPMLPSSSSPLMSCSPQIHQVSRVPSPVSFTSSRYHGSSGNRISISGGVSNSNSNSNHVNGYSRAITPPLPPSPRSTISSSFLGKSSTASIPIKQKHSRHPHHQHQHSGSGSGSSFGSGMLSGLGIMTGFGSFTGASSSSSNIGATAGGDSAAERSGSSTPTTSMSRQPSMGMFAEGYRDVEQPHAYTQAGRHSLSNCIPYSNSVTGTAIAPSPPPPSASSEPDKFNPENVAAAMHWFTLAAAQGDKFSINYLKHKETVGGML
ncbi:hypothetical protein EDD11_001576 [Mortierella claussenii]|nr:hypothetical protein EDD11_001576 [Mortierella claussenii]